MTLLIIIFAVFILYGGIGYGGAYGPRYWGGGGGLLFLLIILLLLFGSR